MTTSHTSTQNTVWISTQFVSSIWFLNSIKFHIILIAAVTLSITASQANAQIVFGAGARTDFENLQTTLGDNFQDFNGLANGTNLTTQLAGLIFGTIRDINLNPIGPFHVEVVSGQIMGSPSNFSSQDGRYTYQVEFDQPQRRAGLQRNWNTFSQTKFFDAADGLLGEHQNTVNAEFVGYVSNSNDTSNWVKRIEMTGAVEVSTRQVGFSDDLFYGTAAAVPEPTTFIVLGIGVAFVTFRRSRR